MVSCIYIDTRRYGISLLMINSISHSFAVFTRELSSWTLEEKFLVYACLCRYKRVTYLWNLIRSMIEVVSKNGDKNHHDELHSALKIAVKRRKTMNTHTTSSWMCFFGGVSGIVDLRKGRSTWESTAHSYLTISGYVWSCDTWWPSSHDVSHFFLSHDNPRNQRASMWSRVCIAHD